VVHIEGRAPNPTSFQSGSPHPGANSFNDQAFFQLSDSRDDDHDRAAESAIRINRLPLRMELDPKLVKLVEHLEEMFGAAGEAVTRPDQHCVELLAMSVLQQLIKGRASDLRPAHAMVNVLMNNLVAALLGELAQLDSLRLWILVKCRNSLVQNCAFHGSPLWGGWFKIGLSR
jgi:hypothetical protein